MTPIDAPIDRAFAALSQRMHRLSAPGRPAGSSESIASLLCKVDVARRRYQPGSR